MDASRRDDHNDEEWILQRLAQSVTEANGATRFAYEFVTDYPFVWVLHPGMRYSPILVGHAALLALREGGYIEFLAAPDGQTGTFILTPAGLARYAEPEEYQRSHA